MYYERYISLVDDQQPLLDQLKEQTRELEFLLKDLPVEQLVTPYAEGKWSLLDLLQHLTDAERVFTYRAMRFARNDRTPLPFFDEDAFAKEAGAVKKGWRRAWKEYKTNRQATLSFFSNQSAAELRRFGIASQTPMSVRACAWAICGHERHHIRIMRERYPGIMAEK